MSNFKPHITKDKNENFDSLDYSEQNNYLDYFHSKYSINHMLYAGIFGISVLGRRYASKMGIPKMPFTASMLIILAIYFINYKNKHKNTKSNTMKDIVKS